MKCDRRWINTQEDVLATLVQIKHRNSGAVIFERTVEGNTVAKTARIASILRIDLTYADFSGQDFSHSYFDGANFAYCDFTGANLTVASFQKAKFHHTSLGNVIANNANFENAILHQAYAKNGSFVGANLHDALSLEGNFDNCDFSHADLRNFGTRGVAFRNVKTDGALMDATDTRIAYRAPRIAIPNVCDGDVCQQCAGCESPKKLAVA